MGLKPSSLDEIESEDEVEIADDLPYGGEREINGAMLEMMADLGDHDLCDAAWIPAKEQRKLDARKKGMISITRC